MKVLVMSDSHDNLWKLEAAGKALTEVDAVIHCGDLCSPFMVRRLAELAGERPVHIVWGNNDGDRLLIARVAEAFPSVALHGELAEVALGGLRVGVNHYPRIAAALARSGDFDLVCYGHDHLRHESRVGECLLLNPGDLMGMKGVSTLAVVEAATRQVSWVELG